MKTTTTMNTDKNSKLNQQIAYLNKNNLAELALFIEFLLLKQEQTKSPKLVKKSNLMAEIQAIDIPVGKYVINRDDIYESHI